MVKHERSNFRKVATEALKETNDVADMLSQAAASEKKNNSEYLLKIISSICFMGRQGLPLRGDGPHMIWIPTSINYCFREQRTFKALMFLWRKKQIKYTSHEIQNELRSIKTLQVIREIASQIQYVPYFTMMIDEAKDLANIEQVALVIRSVNDNLAVTERFHWFI